LKSEAQPALPRPIQLIFGVALAAILTCAAWLVWRTSILEPYSDMYDWIARYEQFQVDGDLGRYLWAPHNFHHLVWTFAILALDIRVFGASGYLFLAVGVASLVGISAMLGRTAGEAAGRGFRLLGFGFAAGLSLMGCHVLDASTDINTTYLHALVFAVAAILIAEAPGERRGPRQAASFACAVASALGSAAGLAVWPALILGAWRRGERGWSFALTAGALVFAALYAVGQPARINPALGALDMARLGETLSLFVNYLGLPWSRGVAQGWVLGLTALAAATMGVAFRGRGGAAWTERAGVSLIVFSLGTAVLAAVARSGAYDPRLVPLRYAVFLIPLHVGLWILALPYLRQAWVRRPRAVEGLIVAASILMVANQADMAVYAMTSADQHLRAIVDFKAGRRTPQMLTAIHPNLPTAASVTEWLRQGGLYQRELRPDPPAAP